MFFVAPVHQPLARIPQGARFSTLTVMPRHSGNRPEQAAGDGSLFQFVRVALRVLYPKMEHDDSAHCFDHGEYCRLEIVRDKHSFFE